MNRWAQKHNFYLHAALPFTYKERYAMRQSVYPVVNPITDCSFGFLLNCTVARHEDNLGSLCWVLVL